MLFVAEPGQITTLTILDNANISTPLLSYLKKLITEKKM